MLAFTAPISIRLNGGLRADAFTLPLAPIEDLLGIRLELDHDLELGGALYRFVPDRLPAIGLAGVLIHPNEAGNLSSTYAHRDDLRTAVIIDWIGHNLIDLGRLEWQLRAAYGDLFDVAEYSIATLAANPSLPSEVHWVQFSAADGRRGQPLADTPLLACTLEFALEDQDEPALWQLIDSLDDDTCAASRTLDSTALGDGLVRQSLRFTTPSLLEPGRYVQAVELAFGSRIRLLGYAVDGDMQRDGRPLHAERSFATPADAQPAWLGRLHPI